MSDVSLQALCGAGELSANAYLLQLGEFRLLLDAGASQPKKRATKQNGAQLPAWVTELQAPDLCWISHAHWDHIGALGALKRRFPRLPCLCSAPTRRLGALALKRPGERRGQESALAAQLQAVASREYFAPSQFLNRAPLRADTQGFDHSKAPKFRAMSFPAGHIPGAEMLMVEVDPPPGSTQQRPFRLLYTGDFCGHDQPLIPGALFPKTGADFPIDVLLMEGVLATHKQYDQVDYAAQMRDLYELVEQQAGRATLIGVARLATAAQVVAGLSAAGLKITVHHALKPVVEVAFEAAGRAAQLSQLLFADERACAQALRAGKAVVAPGEQFRRASPAGRLLAEVQNRPGAAVAIINRAYPSSPAGKLLKAPPAGTKVAHFLLPNHAPRHQLIQAALAVNPARLVLVHGHRSQLFSLKRALQKAGFSGSIEVPENGEALSLARF